MTNDIADLGTLCRALGFLAIAMREDNLKTKGGAQRAEKLAKLIEAFCRLPETSEYHAKGVWSCEHGDDKSVIHMANEGDVVISGQDNAAARKAVEHIVLAVNDNSRKDALIAEMSACLEMCLESDALDWETEQDADILVARAKKK